MFYALYHSGVQICPALDKFYSGQDKAISLLSHDSYHEFTFNDLSKWYVTTSDDDTSLCQVDTDIILKNLQAKKLFHFIHFSNKIKWSCVENTKPFACLRSKIE